MEPITVRYNGLTTVDAITETPDPSMTAGEYLSALIDAHGIGGEGDTVELVLPDGEPVPDDLEVELLSGLTVNLRVTPAPTEEAVELDALTKAQLVDYAAMHQIDLGDAKTKPEILDAIQGSQS